MEQLIIGNRMTTFVEGVLWLAEEFGVDEGVIDEEDLEIAVYFHEKGLAQLRDAGSSLRDIMSNLELLLKDVDALRDVLVESTLKETL